MIMITSPHNPRLQRIRGLLEKRKQRDEEKAFVVEGVRLVEEGLAAGWQPQVVVYSGQVSERGMQTVRAFEANGTETWEVAPALMDSIAGTETPQGLLAVFSRPEWKLPDQPDFILIADQLRDPGNLGTLLRTAAAAGVQAVLLSPGTTDGYAPKVVRAAMGAHFRLPLLHLQWEDIRIFCEEQGLGVFLAEAGGGQAYWNLDLRRPMALLVGSEAEGAGPEAKALAGQAVCIPMPGNSESLNAAVAAGILLFEVVRQRQAGAGPGQP